MLKTRTQKEPQMKLSNPFVTAIVMTVLLCTSCKYLGLGSSGAASPDTNSPPAITNSPPIVTNSPPVTGVLSGRLDWAKAQVVAGVQYYWSGRDPVKDAQDALRAGFTGLDYELMETVSTGDLKQRRDEQTDKIVAHITANRAAGLLSSISFWNSNDPLAKTATPAIYKAGLDYFIAKCGTAGILLQPMSEEDNNTPAAVRTYARAYAAQVWPAAQLAKYNGGGSGGWNETHPCDANYKAGNGAIGHVIVKTDCGGTLADRIGAAKTRELLKRDHDAGISHVIYGFQKEYDWNGWRISGSNVPVTPAPAATNTADAVDMRGFVCLGIEHTNFDPNKAKITRVLRAGTIGKNRITLNYANPGWTVDTVGACMAWKDPASGLMVGGFFDWLMNNSVRDLHNVVPAPGIFSKYSKYPRLPPVGAKVYAWIGTPTERSNVIELNGLFNN